VAGQTKRLARNLERMIRKPFAGPKPLHARERDIEDLMQFTGLDREEVLRYLRREKGRRHSHEFAWLAPDSFETYEWFYRGSRTYVFNAHAAWSRVVEVAGPGMRCLDFGGGGGANAFAMAERGAEVYYVDIGIVNSAYMAFRARKYGAKVDVIDPLIETGDGWRVDTAEAARRVGDFDLIVCDNVLEHVPDYHEVLATLCAALKPAGRILELTPFKREKRYLWKRPREWNVHLRPKLPLADVMASCHMHSEGRGLWRREEPTGAS
jgi:2-polyprenyl-3-methyl-5-hydroxy-6-metoxy-1,4-benzoquinol methylase